MPRPFCMRPTLLRPSFLRPSLLRPSLLRPSLLRPLVVGSSLALVTLLSTLTAHADVQACLGASEKGQRARSAGKLREARDQFQVCGADNCPALVRRDCTQWQSEVMTTLPTVVLGAKDKQGRDLFDVTVSMDGEPLTKKLDGKALQVDPGPHSFKFELAGAPPVIERALVKEGEKTRVITVSFGDGGSGDSSSTAPGSDKTNDHGHTIYPWLVVGAGVATIVVGVVVLLTSPDTPDGCSKSTQTCTRLTDESPQAFADRQSTAGRADAQPTEGLIIGAVGLAVAAGGVLWHFLEPTGPERTGSLHFTPWASPANGGGRGGAGIAGGAIGGRF